MQQTSSKIKGAARVCPVFRGPQKGYGIRLRKKGSERDPGRFLRLLADHPSLGKILGGFRIRIWIRSRESKKPVPPGPYPGRVSESR